MQEKAMSNLKRLLSSYSRYNNNIILLELELNEEVTINSVPINHVRAGRSDCNNSSSIVEISCIKKENMKAEIIKYKKLIQLANTMINTLDEKLKQVLKLYYIDKVPMSSIASQAYIEVPSIYQRRSKALKILVNDYQSILINIEF